MEKTQLRNIDYVLLSECDPSYESKLKNVHQRSANRLLEACLLKGGLYIKVGQGFAAIIHILPEEYTSTLSNLQDKCLPTSQAVFIKDFGHKPEELFKEFDYKPKAAASIAQVFKAKLENGQEVAVKRGFDLEINQVTGPVEIGGEQINHMAGPVEIGREEEEKEDSLVGTDDDQRTGKTDEPMTMENLRSPYLFSDDIYISGPSSSDHTRLIKRLDEATADKEIQKCRIAAYEAQLEEANADKEIQKRRTAAYVAQLKEANAEREIQKRRFAAYEAQLEPQPDSVVLDLGELREVVKCLTTEDKVAQITFDEVFTNNLAVYSRSTDTLIGCQYADDKQKETYAWRQLLTLF
uniref:ABC1 atypical kinase-like domain-containing protein n=1 Tax=Glossina palpalis gambiensis TaxID=67801 RepID=A0A1B0BXB6_9MUSC